MSNVAQRNGVLYFDFRYLRKRCREYTKLEDTAANRKIMHKVLERIDAEIAAGTFDYKRTFPNSKQVAVVENAAAVQQPDAHKPATPKVATPSFSEFTQTWKVQKSAEWRHSYRVSVDSMLAAHLIPALGALPVGEIDRKVVLDFRAKLAGKTIGKGKSGRIISAATVNRVMGIFRQIMEEGSAQLGTVNPCLTVKRLKMKKIDIDPFTVDEVRSLIGSARPDYKDYFTVRFFTGMRSGEVHGLRWKYIDFDRRQILIRETYTWGRTEYTKTDGSQREIQMTQLVFDALKQQETSTRPLGEYVFCNNAGSPLDNNNFNERVWRPLLRHMSLKYRRPYQMRHTCATLWLAAGENPEWIAKQLGHTTTEMLFRVYSRYVPNLTRKDGSAFDRLVTSAMLPKAVATEAV